MVLIAQEVSRCRAIAVSLFRETAGVPRNIHEMPTCGFRTFGFDFVSPIRNCRQIVVTQQVPDLPLGSRIQVRARDVSDDPVAFWSLGK